FSTDPARTDIYTLSLHDALPIWRELEVHDVDPGEVEPRDERPLERAGRAARVAARRDDRTLFQRGAVRHCEAHDRLRIDVDVGEDRKSTRLNSSHDQSSYAVFCL